MPLIIGFLILLLNTLSYSEQATFHEYLNPRFNFQVSYPPILIPLGEPTNGSGKQFKSKNAGLSVYGSFSPNPGSQKSDAQFNIRDEFYFQQQELKSHQYKLGYTFLLDNMFVITATNGKQIAYLKKIYVESCGVHLNLWLYFPQKDKAQWEPWVDKISKSFKYSSKECKGDYIIPEKQHQYTQENKSYKSR